MHKFKKVASLLAMAACFAASPAGAAGGGGDLEPSHIDLDNIASLQRGASNFMNYCSGCHSAQYVRYNTIGKQLELSEEQLIDNLMGVGLDLILIHAARQNDQRHLILQRVGYRVHAI